ncbi:MAG: fluoride efflux transporter FluC [Myxococcota bacterium]
MERLLWISLGGAVGSAGRYLLTGWVLRALGTGFPWGTLAVNAAGSLLLAAIAHVGLTTEWLSPNTRLTLTIGVLGGFTTYSTFSYETLGYCQEGAWALAGMNAVANLGLCLVASFAGFLAARWWVGA